MCVYLHVVECRVKDRLKVLPLDNENLLGSWVKLEIFQIPAYFTDWPQLGGKSAKRGLSKLVAVY